MGWGRWLLVPVVGGCGASDADGPESAQSETGSESSSSGTGSQGEAGGSTTSEETSTGSSGNSTTAAADESGSTGEPSTPGEVVWSSPLGGLPFDVAFEADGNLALLWFMLDSTLVISHHGSADGSIASQQEYPPPRNIAALLASGVEVGPAGEIVAGGAWSHGGGDVSAVLHVEPAGERAPWSIASPDIGYPAFAATPTGDIIGAALGNGFRRYDASGELIGSASLPGSFLGFSAHLDPNGEVWVVGAQSGTGIARRFDLDGNVTREHSVDGDNPSIVGVSSTPDGSIAFVGARGPNDARRGFIVIYDATETIESTLDVGDGIISESVFDVALADDAVVYGSSSGVTKLTRALEPVWSQPLDTCRGVAMNDLGEVAACCNDAGGTLIKLAP